VLALIFALYLAIVLRSVSLGLPRLLVPAGVQLKACRGSLLLSILNTCPRYSQRRLFINVEISSCFVSSLNVLFDLNSFQCSAHSLNISRHTQQALFCNMKVVVLVRTQCLYNCTKSMILSV
jgi:hypothetical protein